MSAPVSRRRVHEARRRAARADAITLAVWGILCGFLGGWLWLLWVAGGGIR